VDTIKYFPRLVFLTVAVAVALALTVCACARTPAPPAWREQYDLGVRFLSEGNYQEAIIAFSDAIEIDPSQPLPYVGRGDATLMSGWT
jgi:Tfp pilus assembly protein PilF